MDWVTLILLLLAGIILVVIEIIFVPGTTILGIIGVALVVFGVIIGYSKFGTGTGTIILISTVVVGGTITFMSFRSGLWKKFALKSISDSKFNDDIKIGHLLGAEGVTLSACRPYGKAEIYDSTYEVKTLGIYLTAGTKVKVTKVDKNNKIYVEQIKDK
jgi:membrane-bound ClpP family serine protease